MLELTPSRTVAGPVIRKPTTTSEKVIFITNKLNSVCVKFHLNVHHIDRYTSACHLSRHCNEKGCIATLSILPQSDTVKRVLHIRNG